MTTKSEISVLEGLAGLEVIPDSSKAWSVKSRNRRPLSESENTQVWNRLGKHPCLSIVLCCEKHDKMECRVCKPPKISWDLYRRVTPNDPFKWHCGTADTASNLAYILKGYHGDGLIMQCLLSRLTGTNGRKELRLTHPNARIDRMKRHCFQHMWFPKFNERLQSLVPLAYNHAAEYFDKKTDMRLDENEQDLELAVRVGQSALKLCRVVVETSASAVKL